MSEPSDTDKLDEELKVGMRNVGIEATDEQVRGIIRVIAGIGDDEVTRDHDFLFRLGGLTDDEAEKLADHNRSEAWVAEQMIAEPGTDPRNREVWEGILKWRQERVRIYKEWAAAESHSQDEHRARAKQTGETDG